MLVKLDTYKIETGEIVATDYVVADGPRRAMEVIQEGDDENVKYHICDEAEERAFWASQMGQSTSPAKAAASRANGRKGGRPRRKEN